MFFSVLGSFCRVFFSNLEKNLEKKKKNHFMDARDVLFFFCHVATLFVKHE